MNIAAPRREGHNGKIHAHGTDELTKCNHPIATDWVDTDAEVTCMKCRGWYKEVKSAIENGSMEREDEKWKI